MLCDICKKREATIHIKEVKNGKCISTNLCPECAKEKELSGGLGAFGFNLAEVIFNVGKMNGEKQEAASPEESGKQQEKKPALSCPRCGWNLAKMRRSGGKLGCTDCYKIFEKWVNTAVEQVQRGAVHVGKRPENRDRSAAAIRMEIDKLQLDLAAAVSAEEYEKAAQFRDRINALKADLESAQSEKGDK